MDIKSKGTFVSMMRAAYRSHNPTKVLFPHMQYPITKDFILNNWANTVRDEISCDSIDHPCWMLLDDLNTFKTCPNYQDVYCVSAFLSFLTRSITFCDEYLFAFIKPNTPMEYVVMEISEEGSVLNMQCNTLAWKQDTAFRVKFGQKNLAFLVENGMQLSTPRDSSLIIDPIKFEVRGYLAGYDFVLVLKDGSRCRVYFNESKKERTHRCPYFVFS